MMNLVLRKISNMKVINIMIILIKLTLKRLLNIKIINVYHDQDYLDWTS